MLKSFSFGLYSRYNFIREYINIINIFINLRNGFIIGPTEYKNKIDKIYFNELVNKNICRIDIIKYIFNIRNQANIEDLFEHINDRYYFLILFQYNINKEIIWYFGEPFYKKYTFTMDLDAKTIGFYLIKEKNYIESKDLDNNNEYNKNNINNEYKIIRFIIELIFLIILVIFAYYIAKNIKERRKKEQMN